MVIAAHQQTTRDWWNSRRGAFELCFSQLVRSEAMAGDPDAASERLNLLQGMSFLETPTSAADLAKELVRVGALPAKAENDALHIAVAAMHEVQFLFLLTWNCRHLANATMRPLIESTCTNEGLRAPIICTPEELLEF